MSIFEIKKRAIKIYKESNSDCISISFILSTIIVFFYLIEKVSDNLWTPINLIMNIAIFFGIVYLTLGFKAFFLRLIRKESSDFYNLIQPKPNFKLYLIAKIEILLISFGVWLILYTIFKDKFIGIIITDGTIKGIKIAANSISKMIALFLLCVPSILINILFVLMPYIHLDDVQTKPLEMMIKSFLMTIGKIDQILFLIIEYMIWFIIRVMLLRITQYDPTLNIVLNLGTIAVLAFFVVPYVQISFALFYNNIIEKEGWKDKKEREEYDEDIDNMVDRIGRKARKNNDKY